MGAGRGMAHGEKSDERSIDLSGWRLRHSGRSALSHVVFADVSSTC
jgi:hypothetical protein